MKKGSLYLVVLMITLLLAACGGVEESTASEEKDETVSSKVENESNESEEIQKNEDSDAEADVFKTSSEKEESNAVQTSENLFDKNKVFEFEDGSIVMTLTNAEFTNKFGPSNADPSNSDAYREITWDSETYLHVSGTINNDTTDPVSFGNTLGVPNFSLLYDGKHPFKNTSMTEVENGTEFGASRVDPLTEGNIHFYFQVPTPVSQTDKSLVLTVTYGDESFEIPLR